jgi:hypothetical protein
VQRYWYGSAAQLEKARPAWLTPSFVVIVIAVALAGYLICFHFGRNRNDSSRNHSESGAGTACHGGFDRDDLTFVYGSKNVPAPLAKPRNVESA